jgi:hypothetical protein
LTYAATFHPSTTEAADAGVHGLSSGETRSDIDVRLVSTRGAVVQGQIVGTPSLPVGTDVRLVVDSGGRVSVDDALEVARGRVGERGQFSLRGVPSGSYRLRLITPGPMPPWLDAAVSISGASEALAVNTDPGSQFEGRLVFLGSDPPSAADVASSRVTLHALDAIAIRAPALTLDAALAFQLGAFPAGRYLADATPPKGWSLRDVLLDGSDISRTAFSLPHAGGREAQFVFVAGVAGIRGRVLNRDGDSNNMLVVLFPEGFATEPPPAHRGRRRQTAVLNDDGGFSFADVPPGRYLLATVPVAVGADWQWAETLERLAAVGQAITVDAGQQYVVDLRRSQS